MPARKEMNITRNNGSSIVKERGKKLISTWLRLEREKVTATTLKSVMMMNFANFTEPYLIVNF